MELFSFLARFSFYFETPTFFPVFLELVIFFPPLRFFPPYFARRRFHAPFGFGMCDGVFFFASFLRPPISESSKIRTPTFFPFLYDGSESNLRNSDAFLSQILSPPPLVPPFLLLLDDSLPFSISNGLAPCFNRMKWLFHVPFSSPSDSSTVAAACPFVLP